MTRVADREMFSQADLPQLTHGVHRPMFTLFDTLEVTEGARRAELIANSCVTSQGKRLTSNRAALISRVLLDVSRKYWSGDHYYRRAPSGRYADEIDAVRQSAEELLGRLTKLGSAARMKIDNGSGRNLDAQRQNARDLIGACERALKAEHDLPAKPHDGRRKKDHIKAAAKTIAKLWTQLTRSPFVKTFTKAKGKDIGGAAGADEFHELSVSFCFEVLLAIDPNLDEGTALKALKSIPAAVRKSRNAAA